MPTARVFHIILAVLLLNAAVCSGTIASDIPIPDPIGKMIAEGKAKVTTTRWDIGDPQHIFDGKTETLLRTPAINPAYVQIEFQQPYSVSNFYLQVAELSEYRITCADSLQDLWDQSRSFRDLTGLRKTDAQGRSLIQLSRPVRARIFVLDTRRLAGDDYVHIFEWQFCRVIPAETLRLEAVPQRPEWKPSSLIASGGVIRLRAIAAAQGVEVDVTRKARFFGQGFRPYRRAYPNELLAPKIQENETREVNLQASYARLSASLPVKIQGWERKNQRTDLDVLFIERLPRLDYDAPDRGNGPGWPAEEQSVEWVAHIRSYGAEARKVAYEWRLDGKRVSGGEISRIARNGQTSVKLPWKWKQRRHTLEFILFPDSRDSIEGNNRRLIHTDALTIGFWIEEKLADYWHDYQNEQNSENNSFEDWAQWMIQQWNRLMAEAIHPLSPKGLTDRWRLDRVVIVPTGALPLSGGLPSNNPDNRDKTVDIVWGFNCDPDARISDYWKQTPWTKGPVQGTPPFYVDWALLHELSHARYLIDSYGFDVHPDSVKITDERGSPVTETEEMRALLPYFNKYKGLMGGGIVPTYDEYTAGALERVKGKRARGGNFNAPSVIGEYIQELPQSNVFTFLDPEGRPVANGRLAIWQAKPRPDAWYGKLFEGGPSLEYTLDDQGCVTLPRNPFGKDPLRHTFGEANTVMLMRITSGSQTYYHFQEVSDFNLAYWKGDKQTARYTVRLTPVKRGSHAH
jgi:hypothetical protein